MQAKPCTLATAMLAVLGTAFVPRAATADVITADWAGKFTMLDSGGNALSNTSAAKGTNSYHTDVSGTITFDTATGQGSATLVPFDFFSNPPSLAAEADGIGFQAIGDGMGGPGSLVLGNMLFSWGGNLGIPVSIVLDAAGFFGGLQGGQIGDGDLTQTEVAGFGATPASDGTYVGPTVPGTVTGPGGFGGYLGLGPVPIATTAWDTSLPPGCSVGDCLGVSPSGVLPLVYDTAASADYTDNQGGNPGIGGSPMVDGPFQGNNANFDITSMTNIVVTPEVPVPAAVWLFGSGLLGLLGAARRGRMER